MTAAAALAFPDGRVLAGWWNQLTPFRPQALWIGHLLLHQIEALVSRTCTRPLAPDELLILRALAAFPGESAAALDRRLPLGRQFLVQALTELEKEKLVVREQTCWSPTPAGLHALQQGEHSRVCLERQTFPFVAGGRPGQPPHFLGLPPGVSVPCPAPEDWSFDPKLLRQCHQSSPEWKHRFGYPQDVQDIIETPEDASPAPPAWRCVLVDRPEQLAVMLVLVEDADRHKLLGFTVRPVAWTIDPQQPTFALDAEWDSLFPELKEEPEADAWRQVWRDWCKQRGLGGTEAENCPLERERHQLRATLRGKPLDKLRSTRSDALKGEAWLLAGTGRFRTAAQVDIVEAEKTPGTSRPS